MAFRLVFPAGMARPDFLSGRRGISGRRADAPGTTRHWVGTGGGKGACPSTSTLTPTGRRGGRKKSGWSPEGHPEPANKNLPGSAPEGAPTPSVLLELVSGPGRTG